MHSLRRRFSLPLLAALLWNPALVGAQAGNTQSRGELLYSTFCVACHTTQMHWRDKRIAVDLPSLKEQVRRWHTNAGQKWSEADIDEVVRHLNGIYYKFPAASEKG
jgi:hypothetical protein